MKKYGTNHTSAYKGWRPVTLPGPRYCEVIVSGMDIVSTTKTLW